MIIGIFIILMLLSFVAGYAAHVKFEDDPPMGNVLSFVCFLVCNALGFGGFYVLTGIEFVEYGAAYFFGYLVSLVVAIIVLYSASYKGSAMEYNNNRADEIKTFKRNRGIQNFNAFYHERFKSLMIDSYFNPKHGTIITASLVWPYVLIEYFYDRLNSSSFLMRRHLQKTPELL